MSPPSPSKINPPAPDVAYFIPHNTPPIGTQMTEKTKAVGGNADTKTFEPFSIRGVEFKNRILAAPMCQYSSTDGKASDWHLVHLGGLAARGIGAICVEASAVVPEGRITPEDAGIWSDDQIAPMKRVVDFCHSQGTKIGVQLAHAGRKASTLAPWVEGQDGPQGQVAHDAAGGWSKNVQGPSPIAFSDTQTVPQEATQEYLKSIVSAFEDAVVRCKKIGYDFIEIHGAHGYFLHNFCSPLSNHRTDSYGGLLENRIRLPLEVTEAVRKAWDGPLFYRLSATDWAEMEEKDETGNWQQWGLDQSSLLVAKLEAIGVDLVDTSSGGNWSKQKIAVGPGYQLPFAARLKKDHPNLLIGAVGLLTDAHQIEDLLQDGVADCVFVAREVMRNADFVLHVAEELGVVAKPAVQYERAWTRMLDGKNAAGGRGKQNGQSAVPQTSQDEKSKDPVVGDR